MPLVGATHTSDVSQGDSPPAAHRSVVGLSRFARQPGCARAAWPSWVSCFRARIYSQAPLGTALAAPVGEAGGPAADSEQQQTEPVLPGAIPAAGYFCSLAGSCRSIVYRRFVYACSQLSRISHLAMKASDQSNDTRECAGRSRMLTGLLFVPAAVPDRVRTPTHVPG